jgi:hypothetical protein
MLEVQRFANVTIVVQALEMGLVTMQVRRFSSVTIPANGRAHQIGRLAEA